MEGRIRKCIPALEGDSLMHINTKLYHIFGKSNLRKFTEANKYNVKSKMSAGTVVVV